MKRALIGFVAVALVCSTVACNANWIQVAIADLPVLVQMALNITTLASALKTGQAPDAAQTAAIQHISEEAQRDLALLQTLYDQYEANPSTGTQQKIEEVIALTSTNLPALLQAAHIKDPELNARVGAAVGLILNTVRSFALLIPHPVVPAVAAMKAQVGAKVKIANASELKKSWNRDVVPQFQ